MGLSTAVAGQRITANLLNRSYGEADATSHTVTAASLTDLSSTYVIPANDAQLNTAYRLTAFGQGTWGSTQQALTLEGFLGPSEVGFNTVVSTTFTASTTFRWTVTLELVIVSTGVSGSYVGGFKGAFYASTANGQGTAPASYPIAVPVNTTIANNFKLQANWASTTGAPTITCLATIFERVN